MSKWAMNDAVVIAENLANVAYQYYLFDDEDEALEYYDSIACGTNEISTGHIYRDVVAEVLEIRHFARERVKIPKLKPEHECLLIEALNIASAYDGPLARAAASRRH